MDPRIPALVLALALLTSGCITIDVTQKVNRDGSSLIIEKIDLSKLPENGEIYGSYDRTEACQEIMEDSPGVGCSYGDGILTLNRTFTKEEGPYLFNRTSEFPYAIYTVELRRTPVVLSEQSAAKLGQDVGHVSDFKEDSSAKATAMILHAAGVEIKYAIRMPGELVLVENGERAVDADGKTYARYDVLELMSDGEYMRVQSRELDLLAIGAVVAGAALLIGGIVVAVVLRRAMEKKKRRGGFGR